MSNIINYKIDSKHPALSENKNLQLSAIAFNHRQENRVSKMPESEAISGVMFDIKVVLEYMGVRIDQRPSDAMFFGVSRQLISRFPWMIPAVQGEGNGDVLDAYLSAISGKLDISKDEVKTWGQMNLLMILSTALEAYGKKRLLAENKAMEAIRDYVPTQDKDKAKREVRTNIANDVARWFYFQNQKHALSKKEYTYIEMPRWMMHGVGYNIFDTLGLISPSKEDKINTYNKAKVVVKQEAKERNAPMAMGALSELYQRSGVIQTMDDRIVSRLANEVLTSDEVAKNRAKDILFIRFINGDVDFFQLGKAVYDNIDKVVKGWEK